jgi:hypothetical protein
LKVDRGFLSRRIDSSCVAIDRSFCGSVGGGGLEDTDGKTQLLIENPTNRYLINSPMLPELKRNSDGSLTVYMQKDSPDADQESTWLPAPRRPSLRGDAALLAKAGFALDLQRHLGTTGRAAG